MEGRNWKSDFNSLTKFLCTHWIPFRIHPQTSVLLSTESYPFGSDVDMLWKYRTNTRKTVDALINSVLKWSRAFLCVDVVLPIPSQIECRIGNKAQTFQTSLAVCVSHDYINARASAIHKNNCWCWCLKQSQTYGNGFQMDNGDNAHILICDSYMNTVRSEEDNANTLLWMLERDYADGWCCAKWKLILMMI